MCGQAVERVELQVGATLGVRELVAHAAQQDSSLRWSRLTR